MKPERKPTLCVASQRLRAATGPLRKAATFHEATMTPDKRATLLTAFKWAVAAALLVGGWITAADWLMAVVK